METTTIEFTRVNNDVNGNPRYVCHFFNLLKAEESYSSGLSISERYDLAVKRANKIGGKRFHNKQYGGGIVFQSYNLKDTEQSILELIK
jgi:hypothetical protein